MLIIIKKNRGVFMSSLRKKRGKYFARIYYKDEGNRREKWIDLHTSNKERAKKIKKSVDNQEKAFKEGVINLNDIVAKEPTNLEKLIDQFLAEQKSGDISPKTISIYKYAFDIFTDVFKDRDIELLNYKDKSKLVNYFKECYDNKNTCNIYLRSIRAFLNWCVKTRRIDRLPFYIEQLNTQKRKPKYFTDAEMKKILEEAESNRELHARIQLHWRTGMRLSELERSELEVGYIYIYDPIKHGNERSIPINKTTEKYYIIADEGSYLSNTISREFRKILRKLGLYKTRSRGRRYFHCLRATYAVRKYYETRDIYEVKQLLGHSTIKTTEKYAQFNLKRLENDFDI